MHAPTGPRVAKKVLESGLPVMSRGIKTWVLAMVLAAACGVFGQQATPENKYKAQEITEQGGVPVLLEHLPEFESIRDKALFAKDLRTLKATVGDRPELNIIDFTGGTEAVTAAYDAGR